MVNATFTVENHAAYVTIEREDKLNAVDSETKRAIIDELDAYKTDDAVRAVVLQSAGDKAFSAGGDVKEIPEVDYSLQYFTESWDELFTTMRNLGMPTIAKVDGITLGGGFDLLLRSDFVIAADNAHIGQPEVDLGIVNHFSPPMLLQQVGLRKTFELLMTGETISGAEAADIGLVTRSVPRDQLDEEVDGLVETLVNKSPRIIKKLKDGIYASTNMTPDAAERHLERISLESARNDPDYREGVDAHLNDRDPEWVVE
ncbi:enoyl-CoA hydratase/isomerase family protein [Natronosalvus halobius]|uniref:enoyl-CoA hydratase/isomerase family protein n=1 Tax=Natronosalvus halobius TaxID=2953746 RepID=UPI0020A0693E|nr:enoyl-CoA hydratase/isomerase family protein [Natronosalvus halobius]USZ73617.1 enoyl-CoA hydratase/isomerase family protein [Natronosalvus halobius]